MAPEDDPKAEPEQGATVDGRQDPVLRCERDPNSIGEEIYEEGGEDDTEETLQTITTTKDFNPQDEYRDVKYNDHQSDRSLDEVVENYGKSSHPTGN